VDSNFNYSTLIRTLRTLRTALIVTIDYKINFKRNKSSEELSLLHSRNADRLVALCTENGGLYQKIGQAIAMQSALLPTEFREKFALFFSETPQASLAEIKQVLCEEYPHLKDPIKELFVEGSFSQRALGSASIAQVHKAQLRGGTGEWVAVKIQKPGISRQVGWDLWVFRFCMETFSQRFFGIPLSFVTPYICDRLQSETDFRGEAANAEMIRELILEEFGKDGKIPGGAGGRVYVPKIYHEYSTQRIMVAEWIDGVLLSSRRAITDPHNPNTRPIKSTAGTGRNSHRASASGLVGVMCIVIHTPETFSFDVCLEPAAHPRSSS
jgi:aarF domain-containing kinase